MHAVVVQLNVPNEIHSLVFVNKNRNEKEITRV